MKDFEPIFQVVRVVTIQHNSFRFFKYIVQHNVVGGTNLLSNFPKVVHFPGEKYSMKAC